MLIEAKIDSDSSDGINSVKIFCYDMTVLQLQRHHNVHSIFHDSRLFDPIDSRQGAALFTLADKIAKDRGYQYIASINADRMESIKDTMGSDIANTIFSDDTIILELNDTSEEDKLLGINVELAC